jgi:N,N'-diacetyllegionaminate synthase
MNGEVGIEPIRIGDRQVGAGFPSFIVAEIGVNHNGDMVLAKEEIAAAKEAGADSVKFQNYFTEDFVSNREITYSYETYDGPGSDLISVTEPQWDMFKRCELSSDNLLELAEYCRKLGISMHSTPTSQRSIDDLLKAGVPVLKNGSDYLTNLDLIRAMGKTGLPTVLSTGMATVAEIDEAISVFYETGNRQLIILHCTSSYPTPDRDVNVQRVKTIRDTWGVLSGFSDHSWGTSASVLSTVYGACWIEKHYTLDKKLRGPDHRFSMDPVELKQLVRDVRAAEQQIGSPYLGPTKSEEKSRVGYRLSCVAREGLPAGTTLGAEHIAYRRPGTGLRPALVKTLLGRTLKADVANGHIFDGERDFV